MRLGAKSKEGRFNRKVSVLGKTSALRIIIGVIDFFGGLRV